ncbi:unnamed protein product [Toxocara canis]|uniref:PCI domain-containing protein n=1 Tax=Toxocara canis TaxID=6265 RepID=A0A183ULL1_TOXCA|nr:unnamed protein product [Toxocara canis]
MDMARQVNTGAALALVAAVNGPWLGARAQIISCIAPLDTTCALFRTSFLITAAVYRAIGMFMDIAQAPKSEANCRSTDLLDFLVSKGFASLDEISGSLRNRLLRAVVQLTPFAGALDESRVIIIFEYLLALIPPLPSEQLDPEGFEDKEIESQLKLSELEAVGLAVYTLFKANKNIFTSLQEQKERHSNWPKRVLYLAGLLQKYVTSANGELKKLRDLPLLRRDKEKIDFLENELKMADNVYRISKDLVHSKPTFSLTLVPSWKKTVLLTAATASAKRKMTSVADESKEKKEKLSENYYVPPGGKYSGSMTGSGNAVLAFICGSRDLQDLREAVREVGRDFAVGVADRVGLVVLGSISGYALCLVF